MAIIVSLGLTAFLHSTQPAAGDAITFAHGWDAGYAPSVALNGMVNSGIDGGKMIAYLGDSTYFTGSPHTACRPRCILTLRVSYHLHCTSTPDGPVIDARQRDVRHRLITYNNGKQAGKAYVIHGVPSGLACALTFDDRVDGHPNDPNQWKILKIDLRLKTPSTA